MNELGSNEQILQRGLEQLREALSCDIELDEWLTEGMSAGPVGVVTRSGPGYNDKVAVKVLRSSERPNWQKAIKDCPRIFQTQHLADFELMVPLQPSDPEWWIATLKIAGGDLSLFRPSVEHDPLKGKPFAASCTTIVKSIIEEWNPDPLPHPIETVPPSIYLNSVFDATRVTPGKELSLWLSSSNIAADDNLIKRPGWNNLLPNPLRVATNLESEAFNDIRPLRVYYGRAHGDLHLRNILMQVKPTPKPRAYKLIDLGGYDSKSPLARDPMHLLLSIGLEWLKRGIRPGTPTSQALVKALVRPHEATLEKEYQEVSRAIHDAGREWAAAKGMGDEWKRQSLLSLAGCSLLYASRQLREVSDTNETRGWFVELAAAACQAYLEECDLWERYTDTYSSPRRKPTSPPSARIVQPQDSMEGQLDIDVTRPNSMSESDEDPSATIFQFPRLPTPNMNDTAQGASNHEVTSKDQWEDLADALQQVVFDASSWLALTANTDVLLRRIRQTRVTLSPDDEDVDYNLQLLEEILARVLRPSASPAELRAACSRAQTLRTRLLGLLAELGQ